MVVHEVKAPGLKERLMVQNGDAKGGKSLRSPEVWVLSQEWTCLQEEKALRMKRWDTHVYSDLTRERGQSFSW